MKNIKYIGLLVLVSLGMPLMLWAEELEVPEIPATPAAIEEVVYARPFELEQGYKFEWRKEQPLVKEGVVLVLKVNPDLVYPRQIAEPVLYVGDQTAERVNIGYKSGHVVVIVPGEVDLKTAPIWFGTPELPERCTAKTIKAEKKMAERAGIKPAAKIQLDSAREKGGKRLKVKDRYELRSELASLIAEHAPDEKELVEGLQVPRVE